jgi:protein-tyrosine-phosphatase
MAEAILDREGKGKFNAFSAGTQPHAEIDPHAVDLLRRTHFDISGLRPKSWDEFAGEGAPRFDYIFTVCDDAAMLPRAMWHGQPLFAHWSIDNPALAQGNSSQIRLAYADAFRMLSNRIGIFVNLPLRSLDRLATQRHLDAIGGGKQAAVVAA